MKHNLRVCEEFIEMMLQITNVSEKETFFFFIDVLKPWVKQKLERRGVQELLKVVIVAESLIELVPRKDKFKSSKPKEKGNDGEDKDRQVEFNNDNDGHSDNEKPQNEKRKSDKPWEKKRSLKCFICEGSRMVKDCSKRSLFSTIKDEPEKAPMRLGSIVYGVEVKRGDKNEKKPVKCFS